MVAQGRVGQTDAVKLLFPAVREIKIAATGFVVLVHKQENFIAFFGGMGRKGRGERAETLSRQIAQGKTAPVFFLVAVAWKEEVLGAETIGRVFRHLQPKAVAVERKFLKIYPYNGADRNQQGVAPVGRAYYKAVVELSQFPGLVQQLFFGGQQFVVEQPLVTGIYFVTDAWG